MKLADALAALTHELEARGYTYALVGGIAASARGEARFTRDIDVAVRVRDDSQAEDVVFRLNKQGYHIAATVEQEAAGRLATARLMSPAGVVCDLIFATSGIEIEIVDTAQITEVFSGLAIPTATPEALLAMKTLSATPRRPRDAGDIQAIAVANPDFDEEHVRHLLRLIEQRGYARGQDLGHKWQQLRQDLGF